MKSYLLYKGQIEGFAEVLETVRVVEKAAASNIHFLRKSREVLDTYLKDVELVLGRWQSFCPHHLPRWLIPRPGRRALLIVGGERRMVGPLWHGLIDVYAQKASQYHQILVVGAQIALYLGEEKISSKKSFTFASELPSKEESGRIAGYLLSEFARGAFTQLDILFPQFVSLTEQEPKITAFLPFRLRRENPSLEPPWGLPLFEPSQEKFGERLWQRYIELFLYRIFLEAKLSEFSARTVVAEHAVEKTKEVIGRMKIDYFKTRRADLTEKQLANFAAGGHSRRHNHD